MLAMHTSRAGSRIALLLAVGAVHVVALFELAALTGTRPAPLRREQTPVLVWFSAPQHAAENPTPAPRALSPGTVAPIRGPASSAIAESFGRPAASGTINWSAEAALAAADEVEAEERARRRAAAFAHPESTAFARAVPRPQFHWHPENKNRIEPILGGAVLHVNDNCAVAVVLLFPFAACTLDKIAARSDLFEHMHDAPEAGTWK